MRSSFNTWADVLRCDERTKYLAAGVVAAAAAAVFQVSLPWAVMRLVDHALIRRDGTMLLYGSLLLVVLAAGSTVASVAQEGTFLALCERALMSLRCRLFDSIQLGPISEACPQGTGTNRVLITDDARAIAQVYPAVIGETVASATQVIALVGFMSWHYGPVALLSLGVLPLTIAWSVVFGRPLKEASRASIEAGVRLSSRVQEMLEGIFEIKVFFLHDWARRQLASLSRDVTQRQFGEFAFRSALSARYIVTWAFMSGLYFFGGREVLRGRLSPGEALALVWYVTFLEAPSARFVKAAQHFHAARASLARVRARLYFETPISIGTRPPLLVTMLPQPYEVSFEHLSFRYDPTGPCILKDVTFRIGQGETVTLVGRNGAGKSTLVGLLLRLHSPERGAIRIGSHHVESFEPHSFRKNVSIVRRDPFLFSGTIADNIIVGDVSSSRSELERAARLARAHEFIVRLPLGYDSPVGEHGQLLSSGQRQRIAIARLFLRNPGIIVLDEAVSGLDPESEVAVGQALTCLMAGRTTLIVTHNLRSMPAERRLIVLDNGQVVANGTHATLLETCSAYRALAGVERSDVSFRQYAVG